MFRHFNSQFSNLVKITHYTSAAFHNNPNKGEETETVTCKIRYTSIKHLVFSECNLCKNGPNKWQRKSSCSSVFTDGFNVSRKNLFEDKISISYKLLKRKEKKQNFETEWFWLFKFPFNALKPFCLKILFLFFSFK